MKIKRLDILGFKSFVDKVSLNFEEGITGVVGPNGCGKSNVVDAIRWVMGEQNPRHLRGRTMEDVIFGGSETRKPHGLAQVTITFDNRDGLCPAAYKDFSEIMVTRRLYRSGESEYLLNKTPCRLLDITELFMDTGVGARAYSIIEQGKVGMLVSAKPEERRALIEEAAGVTKFKARKKSALRKMDGTKQNLVRLGDIIAEVRRQLGTLKRQSQRAEKYRNYRGELKQLELSLLGNKFQQLSYEIKVVATQEGEHLPVLARLDGRLEDEDLQLEEQQLQLLVVEKEQGKAQEQVYHLSSEVQRVENERVLVVRQQEHLRSQENDIRVELQVQDVSVATLRDENQQLLQFNEKAEVDLATLSGDVSLGEKKLQEQLEQERQLRGQVEDARTQLMELFSQTSRLANRGAEIDHHLASAVERRAMLITDETSVVAQIEQNDLRCQQLDAQIEQVSSQRETLAERVEELDEQVVVQKRILKERELAQNELRQQLEKQRTLHESLTELQHNLEGYGDGTRVILGASPEKQIVADLLKVADVDEVAVEMALGARLQAVPLLQVRDVAGVLALLNSKQVRGTLLLPVSTPVLDDFTVGVPLLELITPTAGATAVINQLLSGVFLVDSIDEHLGRALPIGVSLVDRRGVCLDWRGVLSGGIATSSSGGLLRRQRQLDEIVIVIERYEKQFASAQVELDQYRENLLELEEAQLSATSVGHRLELQMLDLVKDRQGLQTEVDHLHKRQSLITFDLAQIAENCAELKLEKGQLTSGSSQAEEQQQQLEAFLQQHQGVLSDQRSGIEMLRERLTEQRVELAASQQQHHARQETLVRIANQQHEIEQRRQQLQQRQDDASKSLQQLGEKDQRLQVELELLLTRHVEQQEVSATIRERFEQQRLQLDEWREQLRRVRAEAEEIRKLVAQFQLRQHELKVDAEAVRANVLDRYRVDLQEHQVPEATADELERQQQQFRQLQQRIEALGEVNLMAIDEYREQEERYNFLTRQREDLNQSLDDLQKAINQINRTTRRLFKETFELVNNKFKEVFPRMFVGGQAELRLTDEDNLLETGVEIVAQPPGKRLQNVNLLSGGEKAFTAVALIFSLFLIKPTPFCVLDEVDAPLDDANIDRFAEIVREMTAQSQFIIITHSKRTMSIVDIMYGVTMQEPGISKLVSVRINDYATLDESGAT